MKEATETARTIEIFTGRRLTIQYENLEGTTYRIIENQCEKNEAVIHAGAAPGVEMPRE